MHPASSHSWAHGRSGPSGAGWVGAKHADSGSKFGATQRDHVLSNMSSDNVPMLRAGVGQDVLNQVVSVLVTGDVNERNARPVGTTFADPIQVSTKELRSANLQALLDNLRRELVRAVLGGVSNNVVDGTAAVGRSAVFADVLDAPVSKLPVGNNVYVRKDFLDAGSLWGKGLAFRASSNVETSSIPCLPRGSSRKCSGRPSCQSLQVPLHATCHAELR